MRLLREFYRGSSIEKEKYMCFLPINKTVLVVLLFFVFFNKNGCAEVVCPVGIPKRTIQLDVDAIVVEEPQSHTFVQKVRSIAKQMNVFPVDFIARRGPLCFHTFGTDRPEICIRTELGIVDFRTFCEFCYLALHASEQDVDSCLEVLASETPKVQALMLTILYIHSYPWSDELLQKNDFCRERICMSWSWLAMNIGCFDWDFEKRVPLENEKRTRYRSVISEYSSISEIAFEKRNGGVKWDREKSKSLFYKQGISVTSVRTFPDRQAFCEKTWKENKTEALQIISDLLYIYYWGDTFQEFLSGTGPSYGNTSATPKTVGQIATQLLQSWEPVELDEKGKPVRKANQRNPNATNAAPG
ncbi:MAG: hypothetical protein Q4D38_09940 [Planctomycetia bacterium]|nr:hypothetical protein [Planctomycetia bacterium]